VRAASKAALAMPRITSLEKLERCSPSGGRGCGIVTRRAKLRLKRRANQKYNGRRLIPSRGDVGHRHERWGEMRWTRQRRARKCDRRAVLRERWQRARRRRLSPAKPSGEDGWLRTAKACGSGTRCWCQVGGGLCKPNRVRQDRQFVDDGDKTNSSPGRARHKP
jgi:hypothetical protein